MRNYSAVLGGWTIFAAVLVDTIPSSEVEGLRVDRRWFAVTRYPSELGRSRGSQGSWLTATMMASNAALELSVEQLISALNKKLFMECTRVQVAMPPMSQALVATLNAEVQSQGLKRNLEC